MFRKSKIHLLLISILSILFLFSCSGIPEQAGNWRVEVSAAGNDHYEVPGESITEQIPPSETLVNIVNKFSPSHMQISDWKMLSENKYWIRSSAGHENYNYIIYKNGSIEDITFKNDSTKMREKAYSLLIKDTKKEISVDEVPQKALETIKVLFPDSEPTDTWKVSTFAGERYLIVVENMAFYVRKDGQIQSARFTNSGALEENYPRNANESKMTENILKEAKSLLGEHQDRFHIDTQIKKIKDTGPAFRFIIMGDSRSNSKFWKAELEHISSLKPKPIFVINSGDLVARGLLKEWSEYFIPPLLDFDIPYLVAMGNHDYGYNKKGIEYRYLFGENSHNYYFDHSGYRFIVIDNVSKRLSLPETAEWLENVLATTPEGFHKIVTAHSPFGNVEKWQYHVYDREYSKLFGDLMSKYKVDHVFFGHIHAYSTATFNGIDYTISGGGGAGLHNRFGPTGNVHHYIICDVMPDGSLKQQIVRFYKK
jgi:predicted phosphodiesterase